jgi:hypothetical protein
MAEGHALAVGLQFVQRGVEVTERAAPAH